MSTVIVSPATPARIHAERYARNRQPVDPTLINTIATSLNHTLAYRGKEVFRSVGILPSTGNVVANWNRFYYHSSPYARDVKVVFLLARDSKGGGGTDSATLTLTSGVFTGTAVAQPGALAEVTGSFNEILQVEKIITGVPADADVAGVLAINNSRVISFCVYELPPTFDTIAGYLVSNFATNQPIYDIDRGNVAALINNMLRRGGSHVFNWCVNNDSAAKTVTSATDTNVIDASTVISASSAGFTINMINKVRAGATKATGILAHYGFVSAGSGGSFKVKSSAGTTLATIAGINTTPQWRTTSLDWPGTVDKYDLMHAASTGTISTIAVSAFLFEP